MQPRPPIYALADALVSEWAALRPVEATFMGVPGHDHEWGDLSPAGYQAAESALVGWAARLDALPPPADRWDALAQHVCRDWVALTRAGLEARDYERDLNSLASTLQMLAMAFDSTAEGEAGDAAVASRLAGLPASMDAYRACLSAGLASGRTVAARQVRAGIEQATVLAGPGGSLARLAERRPSAAIRTALPAAQAAYGALAAWLEAVYLPQAGATDGVGRERYQRELRRFLGASPDPEAAYAWGWQEMLGIHAEMVELAARAWPGNSLEAVAERLRTDPAHTYATQAEFLAAMGALQTQALMLLAGAHFAVPEALRKLDVRGAPGGGQLGAHYMAPSEDLSRPGVVTYLLPDSGPYERWREVSTAWHEGFPGHHLQCGLQVTFTEHLCRLHRVLYGYSGFAEGWALYAEQLMRELGQYADPAAELGMLANQAIRACRVVYDIGAHCDLPIPANAPFHPGERWTHGLGVELLERYGGLNAERAEREITRYLGFPAQAVTYKLGQRAMLELRTEFLAGGHGTLREFHDRVLGSGNVGLDRLREQVLGG